MELNEFLEWIDMEDERLIKHYGSPNVREKILSRTVKLAEEMGELSGEVMSFNGDQRKEKLENHNIESLSHEFADVLIILFLLAKSMDVDIMKSVEKKIDKINKRFEDMEADL